MIASIGNSNATVITLRPSSLIVPLPITLKPLIQNLSSYNDVAVHTGPVGETGDFKNVTNSK